MANIENIEKEARRARLGGDSPDRQHPMVTSPTEEYEFFPVVFGLDRGVMLDLMRRIPKRDTGKDFEYDKDEFWLPQMLEEVLGERETRDKSRLTIAMQRQNSEGVMGFLSGVIYEVDPKVDKPVRAIKIDFGVIMDGRSRLQPWQLWRMAFERLEEELVGRGVQLMSMKIDNDKFRDFLVERCDWELVEGSENQYFKVLPQSPDALVEVRWERDEREKAEMGGKVRENT